MENAMADLPSSTSDLDARAQADDMQKRTRKERRFSRTEADLPDATQHTSYSLLRSLTRKEGASARITDLLSILGTHTPLPAPVESNDSVWLLDNVAYLGPDGQWEAEYVAAVFAQRTSHRISDAVLQVADRLGLSREDPVIATIEKRLVPFLLEIQPGRQVEALHGGYTRITLSPSGRNGITSDVVRLPEAPAGMAVPTTAEVPAGANGLLQAKTFFAAPDGWGIISDIDDTIKITQTSDPIGILQTTFADQPTPTKGMPEFYAYIQSQVTTAAPFFYLSASPYNLYPFLRDFRNSHYPHGQLMLRDSSWMSVPGLLSNLTLNTAEYKVDRIRKIQSWLPNKTMICIGDSTQSDPEAYGEIYRKFPGWVKLILIRKVTDISALGIEAKNEPQRFEAAFKDVPKSAWHVFEDPTECYKLVQDVVA